MSEKCPSHYYVKLSESAVFCQNCGDIKKVPKDCYNYTYPMWIVPCQRCSCNPCNCHKYTWYSPYTITMSNKIQLSDNTLYTSVSPI
jgi:hypothetical protein